MPLIQYGPAGGVRRNRFDDSVAFGNVLNDPAFKLQAIEVSHFKRIDAIRVTYARALVGGGVDIFEIPEHGGDGGKPQNFDFIPGEILPGIKGTLAVHDG